VRSPHRNSLRAGLTRTIVAAVTVLLLQAAPAWAAKHPSPPAFHRDTTPLPAGVTHSGGGSSGVGTASASGAVVRTIVGLAIVLAVVYGLYWLLRSAARARSGQADGRIEVVATTTLAPNRSLHLIRAGDELILVGAAEQSVTPIRVYSADEVQAMELQLATAAQLPQPAGRQASVSSLVEALRRRTAR
jgi:flagellar protein FliO/FliZ